MTNQTTGERYIDPEEEHRGWHGLIGFAVCVMVLQGVFHAIGGFVALFEDDVYAVPSSDLVVTVDYNLYGLVHIALGVGMVLAAAALFWGRTWGRIAAIAVAMLSAITNLSFLSAAPVWYTIMIVIDILVIYAVTMYGGDREY